MGEDISAAIEAIKDDGREFDLTSVTPSGLRGLQERIEALGDRLRVICCDGVGTTLTAALPTDD